MTFTFSPMTADELRIAIDLGWAEPVGDAGAYCVSMRDLARIRAIPKPMASIGVRPGDTVVDGTCTRVNGDAG